MLIAVIAGLSATALADDTNGSNLQPDFDYPTAGGIDGFLISNDTDADAGINPDTVNPVITVLVDMHHWGLELMHHVARYLDTNLDGIADGADGVSLGVRGVHHTAPHPADGDTPENQLPLIWSAGEWIPWGKARHVAISATTPHVNHEDWYGASSLLTAFDADPANGVPRHIGEFRPGDPLSATIAAGRHARERADTVFDLKLDWHTAGSKPPAIYYDPATRRLHIPPIFIDPFVVPGTILDNQGGRSGGVDPAYSADPLIGAGTGPIDLTYIGRDDATGEYLFTGSPFFLHNPVASLRIEGHIGIFRISSTLPGEFSRACAPFERLSVVDTAETDEFASAWALQFVRTGWFGQELSEPQREALVYPVISFTTDGIDLVEATDGFTQPAELPGTVLLSIGTHRPTACAPDLNEDDLLNFFDVQQFLAAFASHDPAADWNHDGTWDFFDVQAFLAAFSAGCP